MLNNGSKSDGDFFTLNYCNSGKQNLKTWKTKVVKTSKGKEMLVSSMQHPRD